MSAGAQALTILDDHPTPPKDDVECSSILHDVKIAIVTPTPPTRPVPASDPLGAIKAMSEEEKIALFT